MDEQIEAALATELYRIIHRRLGHCVEDDALVAHDPLRSAWIEIAREFRTRCAAPRWRGRWLDDYAEALYEAVHGRLCDGRGGGYEDDMPVVRRMWREVASYFDERHPEARKK